MSWYESIYRKIHLDTHVPPDRVDIASAFDADRIVGAVVEAGAEAVCISGKCHFGNAYYPTRAGRMHPHLRIDLVGELSRRFERSGLPTLVYYSCRYDQYQAEARPEWRVLGVEGPIGSGIWQPLCFHSPYVTEVVLPQLRELMEWYPLAGCFLDFTRSAGPCYCAHCRERFAWEVGGAIPRGPEDPRWREYVSWKRREGDRFDEQACAAVHAIRPEALVGSNYNYSLRQPVPPPAYLGYLSLDVWERDVSEGLLESAEARYLASTGKPFDVMTTRMTHWWGDWGLKPIAAMEQQCATILSNGGRTFLADELYPSYGLEPAVYRAFREVNDFIRAREPFCRGAEPVPFIGILHSAATYFAGDSPGVDRVEALAPILGAHKALVQSGVHCAILGEDALLRDLARYQAIVLPEQGVLPEPVARALAQFVRGGGALLGTGDTLRAHPSLAAVFGVTPTGELPTPHGYIQPGADLVEAGVPDLPLQVYGRCLTIQPTTAEPLARLVEPLFSAYAFGLGPPGQPSNSPAAALNRLGRGRAVFVAGPVFRSYWEKDYPALRRLVAALLQMAVPDPLLEVAAPPCVEVALATQGERTIVHLVNCQHDKQATGKAQVDEMVPVRDIRVRLRRAGPPLRVTQEPEHVEVPWLFQDGCVQATVPELAIHSCLVIE